MTSYENVKADPVRYEKYLERKRRESRARQEANGYETNRKRIWRQENAESAQRIRQAGHAVEAALRTGRIAKGKKCAACGTSKRRLEGHHHKGYERKYWLEVIWLCPPCHRKKEDSKKGLPLSVGEGC